jgi:hypothetical protein
MIDFLVYRIVPALIVAFTALVLIPSTSHYMIQFVSDWVGR